MHFSHLERSLLPLLPHHLLCVTIAISLSQSLLLSESCYRSAIAFAGPHNLQFPNLWHRRQYQGLTYLQFHPFDSLPSRLEGFLTKDQSRSFLYSHCQIISRLLPVTGQAALASLLSLPFPLF